MSDERSTERPHDGAHRRSPDASPTILRLGRFTVLEELGRGGMGVVYAAYDEELDRMVALKLLHEDELPLEEERLRLRREAQALARVSHPNVVAVHEVGEDDGTVFVAMELVRGESVKAWLKGEPEPSQVLDVFVRAGRGLMAAHAEGLVHRDFKPHNVMRSEVGAVKVLDFGLVRVDGQAFDPSQTLDQPRSSLATEFTRTGTIMGTPAYMAPEQHTGETVDHRTDQYSFCVALWEGLTRTLPFDGTLDELRDAKRGGPPPWPATAPVVPRAVVKALSRGLAVDPEKRWPSMKPLLDALHRTGGRRRTGWLLGGGAALVLAVGTAGAYDRWETARAQRCSGAAQRLEGVWDSATRDAVRTAMMGTGKQYAVGVWERTERNLDAYANDWAKMHTEACEATARGEQSASMLDMRMACLQRAVVSLDAVVETLKGADEAVVSKAHDLVGGLQPLSRCVDTEALAAEVEPPRPEEATAVEAARRELARCKTQRQAGRFEEAREALEAARAALEGIGYEPVLTEVALEEGAALDSSRDPLAAKAAYLEALERGLRWRQREHVLDAASRLIFIFDPQIRPDEGMRYIPLARGLAFGQPEAEARVHHNISAALDAQGKHAEAEAELRAALSIQEAALGPEHADVAGTLLMLGHVMTRQGRHEEAEAILRKALSIEEATLGPGHRSLGGTRINLGNALREQGKHAEAEAEYRAAVSLWEETVGPDYPNLDTARGNLGVALGAQGKHAEAEAQHRAVMSRRLAAYGPDHPSVAASRINLGASLISQEKHAEAEAQLRPAVPVLIEAMGADHLYVAYVRGNLSHALMKQGKYAEAEAELSAAMPILEARMSSDDPELASMRVVLGRVLLEQGKPAEAETELRAGLSVMESAADPDDSDIANAHKHLRAALEAQGKDPHAEPTNE